MQIEHERDNFDRESSNKENEVELNSVDVKTNTMQTASTNAKRKPKFNFTTTTMGHSQSQPALSTDLVGNLKTVGVAKSKRAMVEKDVEMLHNRIKMLQMEEMKAMKKINETRKKAEKIMELRKENDLKYEQKVKDQIRYQQMLKKRRNQKYAEEQERQRKIANKIETIKHHRKAEAFVVRKCGKNNDKRKQKFKEHVRNLNKRKAQMVQEQEKRWMEKVRELNNQKESQKLSTNHGVIEEQKQKILQKEEEAKQLERLEAELLRRLQMTQQREKDVFNMLESAMIDSSKPRKDRYVRAKQQKSNKRFRNIN